MTARIALDAMGGDDAPRVPVEAALEAVNTYRIPVSLVGNVSVIESIIGDRSYSDDLLELIDAPESVSMEDEAVAAVRRKRRASIPVGLELVKSGAASAFVSGGNTGAVVASSTVSLGRLPGVSRPGIAVPLPTVQGKPVWLIDAGALVDPRPEHLWQHARLASRFVRIVEDLELPRVGLISNGEESSKGNALTRETHALLADDDEIEFVGNVESRAIPRRVCDVAITDGFTGNIILKTAEGIVNLIQDSLRSEFRRRLHTSILALLLRPAFRRAGRQLDYREYGGAPLLGVNGLVFIAHGSSDELAVLNAIREANRIADQNLLRSLHQELES